MLILLNNYYKIDWSKMFTELIVILRINWKPRLQGYDHHVSNQLISWIFSNAFITFEPLSTIDFHIIYPAIVAAKRKKKNKKETLFWKSWDSGSNIDDNTSDVRESFKHYCIDLFFWHSGSVSMSMWNNSVVEITALLKTSMTVVGIISLNTDIFKKESTLLIITDMTL